MNNASLTIFQGIVLIYFSPNREWEALAINALCKVVLHLHMLHNRKENVGVK